MCMPGEVLRTSFTLKERGLQCLVRRNPPAFATAGYSPENTTWDEVRLLLVGAGGIGCEVLHSLALSGFAHITVVDMDTIELSNLNRQFLFRERDIGRSKAEVAAAFVERRCPGVQVHAIFGRIEDQTDEFYRQFHMVVLGVDSVVARRWMNQKISELAEWEVVDTAEDRDAALDSGLLRRKEKRITGAIPIIDTGTEGYEGCCRLILMGDERTPCVECALSLYPQRKTVPVCTLENIPRSPEHCVLYVQLKMWEEMRPDEPLDADNAEHIAWIRSRAQRRKEEFGILGPVIDDPFTLGVVKNVVPAVGFTNAFVAGQATLEVLKLLTGIAPSLQCFSYFNGSAECGGLTSYVTSLFRDPACPVCAPRPVLLLSAQMKPLDVMTAFKRQIGLPAAAQDAGQPDVTLRVRFGNGGEVYLMFNSNNPLKTQVVGTTVKEIFAAAGHATAFSSWCGSEKVTYTIDCSGPDVHISAEAVMSDGAPLS